MPIHPCGLEPWPVRPRECVANPHAGVDCCTHQIHAELNSFDVLLTGIAPRTKKVAHKRLRQDRDPTPPPETEFIEPEHQ